MSKHSSLLQHASTGVNLIKPFWSIFTHSFCKLDLFLAMKKKILLTIIKWSTLEKCVSKFAPKLFYEIDPWPQKEIITTEKSL
jgi:hypothetical protein